MEVGVRGNVLIQKIKAKAQNLMKPQSTGCQKASALQREKIML